MDPQRKRRRRSLPGPGIGAPVSDLDGAPGQAQGVDIPECVRSVDYEAWRELLQKHCLDAAACILRPNGAVSLKATRNLVNGLWTCYCGKAYATSAEAGGCLAHHCRLISLDLIGQSSHGCWLAEGTPCPSCGSLDGGWVCAGDAQHLTSCGECMLDSCIGIASSSMQKLHLNHHCFHGRGEPRRASLAGAHRMASEN